MTIADKEHQYRDYVQQLMTRYAAADKAEEGVDIELVMDTARDHYQWMNVGWVELKRVYSCFIHIDIKDGKIWLQQNWTEEDPAADLVEMGVPWEDIVLGLHSPYKRPYTDYGVA
jgi:hypothetical protein